MPVAPDIPSGIAAMNGGIATSYGCNADRHGDCSEEKPTVKKSAPDSQGKKRGVRTPRAAVLRLCDAMCDVWFSHMPCHCSRAMSYSCAVSAGLTLE